MGDVSKVLGINVTRDREEGTITIDQKDYMEDIVQRYGMRACNPAYTPGMGPELSLYQQEENLLNEEGKRRHRSITGAAMYLSQVYATTSSTPSTSWQRQCPSHLRYIWGRPSTYYATWPGPPIYRSPTSKEISNSRPFPTQTGEQTPIMGTLYLHT